MKLTRTQRPMGRFVSLVASMALFATACGSGDDSSAKPPTTDGAASSVAADSTSDDSAPSGLGINPPRSGGDKYLVYVTTLNIGNAWQEEANNLATAIAKTPPYDKVIEVRSETVAPDVQSQIAQIQSMVSSGADAIVAYPISPTGLNAAYREACDAGVVMVAFDATVTEPCVTNVSYITAPPRDEPGNPTTSFMGYNTAKALAELLGGKGNIFVVRGIVGTSTDKVHYDGAIAAFSEYPGIKIVAEYEGKWDSATQQIETSKALVSFPDVDGIWAGYGESGTIKALQAAGLEIPVTGETSNFFRVALLNGWPGISAGSPPAQGGIAMKVAIQILLEGPDSAPDDIEIPMNWVPADRVKECTENTYVQGCNVFPAAKVGDENTAEIFQPELLPEASLSSAQTGDPTPGMTIEPLPDLSTYQQPIPHRFVTRQTCPDGWTQGKLPEGVDGCVEG